MKSSTLFAISAMLLLSSCNINTKEEPEKVSEIKITGSKITDNSASGDKFKIGSKIGIYMTTAASPLLPTSNIADNVTFTSNNDGIFTTTANIKYPISGNVDFYAYTPISATGIDSDQKLSFTIATDQTSSLEASDLLWNSKSGVSATDTPVDLAFNHMLSKIVITLIAGENVTLSSPTLKLNNILPTVKMNMQTGTLDNAEGSPILITPNSVSETILEAIIIPQTLAQDVEIFQITNGGKNFSYKLPKEAKFESHKSYTYDITIKEKSIDIKFTGTINGWIPGDTTIGDVI